MGSKEIIADIESKLVDLQAAIDSEVAAGSPQSDKVYSQDELDAKVQEAIAADQADIESQKAQAVNDFKAELAKKYEDLKVVEAQAETGFSDLLK